MSSLEHAIELAARAHAGQLDKAGQPYILHPLRLMLAVHKPHERMAAILHDVVEDTPMTFEDLVHAGFPTEVVTAVQALTKQSGESRIDAAHRAAADPIARVVKLADVTDNMDLSRIPSPTEKDYARIQEYEQVRQILLDAMPENINDT
jgi:GTP diphosphokinase / guanosine-3',5'-bis(diphosphate) 3'-diphosphatase